MVNQSVYRTSDTEYKWTIKIPEWLSERGMFSHWERERFDSMESVLKKGDVLLDIGTEWGWQSVIYAKFVRPQNMILVEPNPEFWPCIKEIWEANFSVPPLACFCGLISDTTTAKLTKGWPPESDEPLMASLRTGFVSYRNILEHRHLPQITLDDITIKPDAITIDVEGAEEIILRGGDNTLKSHPTVWVSVHPELMDKYHTTSDSLIEFMRSFGYNPTLLAQDHEKHWIFT